MALPISRMSSSRLDLGKLNEARLHHGREEKPRRRSVDRRKHLKARIAIAEGAPRRRHEDFAGKRCEGRQHAAIGDLGWADLRFQPSPPAPARNRSSVPPRWFGFNDDRPGPPGSRRPRPQTSGLRKARRAANHIDDEANRHLVSGAGILS